MKEDAFIAYIDEAGDPGLDRVRPDDPDGSSEWLTLGAIVVRAHYAPDLPEWVRSVRTAAGALQGPELHFRRLSKTKRVRAAEQLAQLPLRAFCVASNKRNMKGYRNERAEKELSQAWFYNWLGRVLLERISDCVHRQCMKDFGEPRVVRVVFSQRGGMAYTQTRAYVEKLRYQQRAGTTVLKRREVQPSVLDIWRIDWERSIYSAGAQLADVVASAFYAAADGNDERPPHLSPALALSDVMARKNGRVDDYGLVLLPTPHQAELIPAQKPIFQVYGHVLSGE